MAPEESSLFEPRVFLQALTVGLPALVYLCEDDKSVLLEEA